MCRGEMAKWWAQDRLQAVRYKGLNGLARSDSILGCIEDIEDTRGVSRAETYAKSRESLFRPEVFGSGTCCVALDRFRHGSHGLNGAHSAKHCLLGDQAPCHRMHAASLAAFASVSFKSLLCERCITTRQRAREELEDSVMRMPAP